jgi:hypothetical protein
MDMQSIMRDALKHSGTNLVGTKEGAVPCPRTDDELHDAIIKYFGVNIPRRAICKNHVAPFTAFADAFFARQHMAVWKASRGFGGKSMLLALLALAEAVFIGAQVNLLGGSGEQSERVLNYMNGEEMPECFWGAPDAPRHMISGGEEDGLLKKMTKISNGGYIKALMASTKSVRGPHPQRLRLDEADEMDLNIFDSALGQPMRRLGIDEQIVASSTHHYANGTMTEILKRAKENKWGVYEWCYRENLEENGGWLEQETVEKKRAIITANMWLTEYENQEPNPTGRAIDIDLCNVAFRESLAEWGRSDIAEGPEWEGDPNQYIEVEPPYLGKEPEPVCHRCKHPYDVFDIFTEYCELCEVRRRLTRPATYATGTDWAKKKDWTIVHTIRTDVYPARLVAWLRVGRLDWPSMVAKLEDRMHRYRGGSYHDITGIGDVIGDYLKVASEGQLLVGYERHEILSHYISAIEHGKIIFPRIRWMYDEHRLASVEDVYSSNKKFHLPDTMAAGALAWKASGLGLAGEIMIPGVNCLIDAMKAGEQNG